MPLTLRVASMTTTLAPYGVVARTSLPFAALTSPTRPGMDLVRHRHQRRSPLPVNSLVQPSDIALLIALAQRQEAALPLRASYTVHVLAPDETARNLRGLTAEIHAAYLLALKEPWRPMEAMEVQLWEVPIGDEAEGLAGVVGALGESAVRLKRKMGRKPRC